MFPLRRRAAFRVATVLIPLCFAGCNTPHRAATRPAPPGPGVARFDVSPGYVQGLADEHRALPLTDWPLYQNTNLPVMHMPQPVRSHAATQPKFSGQDLGLYRVMAMTIEGRPTYVFYHQLSKTLVLIPVKQ